MTFEVSLLIIARAFHTQLKTVKHFMTLDSFQIYYYIVHEYISYEVEGN